MRLKSAQARKIMTIIKYSPRKHLTHGLTSCHAWSLHALFFILISSSKYSLLHGLDELTSRDEMLPFCAVVTIHNVKKISKFLSLLSIWYIFSAQLKCAALPRLELRSPLLGDRSSSRVWVAPGRSPSCAVPPPPSPRSPTLKEYLK